jgi:hyperosmotically inducible protein
MRIKRNILSLIGAIILAATATVTAPAKGLPSSNPLEKKVRKELVTLPYYGVFDNLAFSINGGTVTLYGKVVHPSTRSEAQSRIAHLSGVNRVVNKIDVLPPSSFDDSLRRSTYRSVFSTAGLYRYGLGADPSIHIIVDHGRVTLEGVVDNQADAHLAYVAALRVPGAFAVTNNLRVAQKPY